MTKEEFHKNWTLTFPETILMSHLFKNDYSDRWFRIHSLPESKRYAENDNEWKILLSRQNEIITDLFEQNRAIFMVTGEYILDNQTTIHLTEKEEVFKPYLFTQLDNIDLHIQSPEDYDKGEVYSPAFTEIKWEPNQYDKLLREIANDNVRVFFLSFDQKIIVAPYDGGVDFILKDSLTKDLYKNKYKQWLSKREDGL